MTIQIVTDSSVRFLNPDNNHHDLINLVPTTVRFKDEAVEDRPDLQLNDVRTQFEADPGNVYADPPSVEQLVEVYSRLQAKTDEIVSIHTSAGINSAFRNAVKASEGFRGRCDIQVLDSTSLSAGLGMLVSSAATSATAGISLEDAVRIVRGIIPRMYIVFFLDDLSPGAEWPGQSVAGYPRQYAQRPSISHDRTRTFNSHGESAYPHSRPGKAHRIRD